MDIFEARGLIGKDISGNSDPFCTFYLTTNPLARYNTSYKARTLNPVSHMVVCYLEYIYTTFVSTNVKISNNKNNRTLLLIGVLYRFISFFWFKSLIWIPSNTFWYRNTQIMKLIDMLYSHQILLKAMYCFIWIFSFIQRLIFHTII